mgnify:CR=1 FL=1
MAKKTKKEKDFKEAVGSNVGSAIVNLLQSLKMKDGGEVKKPKGMRGGGVALRGFGKANYSNKDI